MNNQLELYLAAVEKHLRRMTVSERTDILKELKSYMEELQQRDALSPAEIVQRLGASKELAAGYLSEKISSDNTFHFKKILLSFSFYSLTSLSGLFVLPCGTVLAGGLMLSGILAPLAGFAKIFGHALGFDTSYIIIQFFGFIAPPWLALPLSAGVGALLFWAGNAVWKWVMAYIRKVGAVHRKRMLDA